MMHGQSPPAATESARPQVTRALTLGVCRHLRNSAVTPLQEFKLGSGRRADIAGLDRQGRFTIVEVKSSPADFHSDAKWPEYLEHADFFYFAVGPAFPLELLPAEHGVLVADRFGAAVIRAAEERPINANRRRHQTLRFARQAAANLIDAVDPNI
ncbi:MAG: MmcB family DNA repair protein [Rhodospirillaceae bacterium]